MTTRQTTFGEVLPTVAQGVQIGGSAAAAVGTAAHAAWVPVVGPIVAGVSLALALFMSRKGPKQKIATTQIVDELEPLLKQNLAGYLEGPRTEASQAQALKNFDDAWIWLNSSEACGRSDFGEPGRRCIGDRNRGGQWDWFQAYRDPIANDDAKPDSLLPTGIDLDQGNQAMLLLALGLVIVGVIL